MTEEQTNNKPLEVLVIDDDEPIRELFHEIIQSAGANVTTAIDGKDGIEKYIAKKETGVPYDAVLTDLIMPRASGVDVTRRVKELSPKTQVIVVTGFEPNSQYKALSEQLGQLKPDGILQKPITPEGLMYVVNQVKSVIEKRKIISDYQPQPSYYKSPQPQS